MRNLVTGRERWGDRKKGQKKGRGRGRRREQGEEKRDK